MANRLMIVEVVANSKQYEAGMKRASGTTKAFEKDVSRASRGALAGAGIFRSFGRSLAFASGGFLAFGGAASFIRTSIDAAKDAQVVNQQLAAQFKASGRDLASYREEIDRTTESLSALTGFQDDELKGALTTILRTQPNVAKALRDTATAADLARARHIGLAAAATLLAKVEGGNTTLLRRQGIQVAKNATVEEALATLREKVARQAAAGATEQEKFGAVLHNTEEIIGQGILPTLNEYLASGAKWLEQMNESGKLQRDVASGAHALAGAVDAASTAIHDVDEVTGSFKNTLELLLGLKVASTVAGWSRSFGALAGAGGLGAAEGEAGALLGTMGSLAALGPITLTIAVAFQDIKDPKSILKRADQLTHVPNSVIDALKNNPATSGLGSVLDLFKHGRQAVEAVKGQPAFKIPDLSRGAFRTGLGQGGTPNTFDIFNPIAAAAAGGVTVSQRNTFFDNQIARILLRGGLGNISQQIAALQKADALITARLAKTKDVTRKLNLEDELLQNQAQIDSLKAQQAADAQQKAQEAHQKAVDALAKRLAARTSRQFRELGFTGTGENVTPAVPRLRKELGAIDAAVKGTPLDKPALEKKLAGIRKVLGEGIVPTGIRQRIQEELAGVQQALDAFKKRNQNGPLTKTTALSTANILAGVGLSPLARRELAARLSHFNSAGVALTGSGSGSVAVSVSAPPVYIDGRLVSKSVGKHQARTRKRNAVQRTGPLRGVVIE